LFEEVEADTDFGALCADTVRMLTMFETFVEKEFERQKLTKRGMPIARRLTEQRKSERRKTKYPQWDRGLTTYKEPPSSD